MNENSEPKQETKSVVEDAKQSEAESVETRRELAREFYRTSVKADDVRSEAQIDSDIEKELKGIDFTEDVTVEAHKKGEIFAQFRTSGEQSGEHPHGNYFAAPGADPMRLGIAGESFEGRQRTVADYFALNCDIAILKSTAADADSFYRKDSGELLYGGETQYYSTDKDAFERVIAPEVAKER